MIFGSARSANYPHSSNKEACLSIIGLILVVGLVSGLAGLIYGLVKGSSSGTIGGAVVLGISLLLTTMFIFMIIFCLKNNNVESDMTDQEENRYHQPKQTRTTKNENSSREITTVSTIHPIDHMQSSSLPVGLADSTNYGVGKQAPHSPSVKSSFNFLNQSYPSANNLRENNKFNRH